MGFLYPVWVLLLPLWIVYGGFRGWFDVYVDRHHLCVGVFGVFSLDLCGSFVHDEFFNSRGGSIGSGDSSQLEIFLVTPLEIWG